MDVKLLRHQHHMNQAEFWARVGITQSGGSRYEAERNLPAPVSELVRLNYILGIDTRQINAANKDAILLLLAGGLNASKLSETAGMAQDLISALHRVAAKAQQLGEGL